MKTTLDKYAAAKFMSIELSISKEDLKKRYLILVREYHPDVSTLPNATELIQKLNDAYNLLKEIVPININSGMGIDSEDTYIDLFKHMSQQMSGMSGFGGFDPMFFEQMMRRPKPQEEDVKFFSKEDRDRFKAFQQASERAERMKEDSYNQPPPKQETKGDWKRSQAGNLYKTDLLGNRTIIFLNKTGKIKYRIMKVFVDGEKVYYDEVFDNEDMAVIYADQMF